MINLIFDLNNIVHRSLFIVGGYGSKMYTFDSQTQIDQLVRKIAIDISYIIRIINPARVILAQDDSSWRKSIKIEENDGYKANRVKSKMINWDNVYDAINDFTQIVTDNNGMILTKISSAEADDIITLWTDELVNNQQQHVIIVSGDEDIRQLVKKYSIDNKTIFVTVFNPFMQGKNSSRKLYVPDGFEKWLNGVQQIDFIHPSIDIDKEDFKKIILSEHTKVEVIDGEMIALYKIFCGDDGDNVPSIFTWLNNKNVEVRITNSKFEKIYEYLKTSLNKDKVKVEDIINNPEKVLEAIKLVTKQSPSFDISKRIERQLKLVFLNTNIFPKEIIEEFNKLKYDSINKPRVSFSNVNMYSLLEGTKYVTNKKHENESSIFKEIDEIRGKMLF